MSLIPSVLRAEVVRRAGGRCEYCHLPTTGQVATFPIDQVSPRDQGGPTALENLALANPHCNGHK
jgi:5-methylcytosine-specific restriction endonuclease McrA